MGSGLATTLFCPKCDYNLTGLTECRCPECGTPYAPEEIQAYAGKALKPITFPIAVFQLVWPPVVFGFLYSMLVVTRLWWLWATLMVVTLVYSMVNATELGHRIAASLSIRRGGSPYSKGPRDRLIVMGVVLGTLQILMNLATMYVGLKVGLWMRR